jgi:hypothetical protein
MPNIEFTFRYAAERIDLVGVRESERTPDPSSPLNPSTHSGVFVELRSLEGTTLYRQSVPSAMRMPFDHFDHQGTALGGGMTRVASGSFRIVAPSIDAAATVVVLASDDRLHALQMPQQDGARSAGARVVTTHSRREWPTQSATRQFDAR